MFKFASNVSQVFSWPCHLDRMLINFHRAISPYLDVKLCWSAEHMSALAERCQNLHFLPLPNRLEKLTYWSQIVSSAEGNPISPGYLWESPISLRAWDLRVLKQDMCVSRWLWYKTLTFWKQPVLWIFTGVKLNKSNILYLDSDLNPQSPFQTIWIWDASVTFCSSASTCLWPYRNCLGG